MGHPRWLERSTKTRKSRPYGWGGLASRDFRDSAITAYLEVGLLHQRAHDAAEDRPDDRDRAQRTLDRLGHRAELAGDALQKARHDRRDGAERIGEQARAIDRGQILVRQRFELLLHLNPPWLCGI